VLAKLCFLILSVGAIGLTVLSLRQQRTELYHTSAVVQRELASMDRRVQQFQAKVAAREVPANVTQLAATLGPLRSIGVDDAIFQTVPNPLRRGVPPTAIVQGPNPVRAADEPAPRR